MLLQTMARFCNFISERQSNEFCRVFDEMGCKPGHPSPESMIYHESSSSWSDLYITLRNYRGTVELVPLLEDYWGELLP